jgi:hypothetical protein
VNGREVEYQAISLDALRMSWRGLETQYKDNGESIDPPTYEIKTAGGSAIPEPHDATTEKTPEEQAAWDAHQEALGRLKYEKNMYLMQYIFEDGLESIQVPEDEKWLAKHKRRLIDIPTDKVKLREFYLTAEVLKTPDDIAGITAAIMLLSQQGKVDEAALDLALDSFRDYLGRKATKRARHAKEQVEARAETV